MPSTKDLQLHRGRLGQRKNGCSLFVLVYTQPSSSLNWSAVLVLLGKNSSFRHGIVLSKFVCSIIEEGWVTFFIPQNADPSRECQRWVQPEANVGAATGVTFTFVLWVTFQPHKVTGISTPMMHLSRQARGINHLSPRTIPTRQKNSRRGPEWDQ